MKNPPVKPWSEVDEDLECAVLQADRVADDVEVREVDETSESEAPSLLGQRLSTLRLTASWALAPLGLACAWLILGMVFSHPTSDAGMPLLQMFGILTLVAAGGVILVFSQMARKNNIGSMIRALNTPAQGATSPLDKIEIEERLRPVWRTVEARTNNISHKLSEVVDGQQQLMLEVALAEKQKRHAIDILNTLEDPLLVVNAFGQLIDANAAAESLFVFDSAQVLRKPMEEILTDESLLSAIEQARTVDFRAAERRGEHTFGTRTFGSALMPLKSDATQSDSGDEHHGVVVTLRDITREREAAHKKSDFVAHVSHELRTPLSSIRAYVEMLVDGEAGDEATRREYYDIIQTSADRLGRLIDNMLNISRIEAGTVRVSKEPMAISMVVKEAVDMMRPAAEEKKIQLTQHLTPVMYRVDADRDLLYQAILNLISNAIKYTNSGGEVTVRMTPREENETMVIEVTDTGVGIPKEDLPRMFEKFFRVEANKKLAKGTGLGLNLVKNIVERIHEGELTLKSEVGVGSTFGVVLPMIK